MLGVLAHQVAAEFERAGVGCLCHFIHEALGIDAVLGGVDAAPGADWHVAVAHRVLEQKVGHGVAKLRVVRFGPKALQLPAVVAITRGSRVDARVDGLARDADVQAGQLVVRVKPGAQFALRDWAVEVMRHVLLAAPDHLDWRAGKLLGNRHRLARVVLIAAAPAKAAAEVMFVNLALRQRQA